MLYLSEKILFVLAFFISVLFAFRAIQRLIFIISIGKGKPNWGLIPKRLGQTIVNTLALKPAWRLRQITSLFHALVVWGFTIFLLVNLGDVLQGFIPDFVFLGTGYLGNFYRMGVDFFSVGVII